MEDAAIYAQAGWFQATARQRIAGLLDPNSFTEFLGPSERIQSPHLHLFDLPSAFDDGVIIGRGKLDGKDVFVAAQEGQFMGGTFAEVSGAKMVGLIRAARDHKNLPQTILLLLDSGGVRLQEANAGELVVAELMRAIVQARGAGVAVIALIGGKAGAFGGAGLTAATCSRIVVSEQGRIAVTGPEVIETNKGVEEFDSQNKALVWSTDGGKNRRLIGGGGCIHRGFDGRIPRRSHSDTRQSAGLRSQNNASRARAARRASRAVRCVRRRRFDVANSRYQRSRGYPGYGQQGVRSARERNQRGQP
jgi:malonate decarboxylase beta subunit